MRQPHLTAPRRNRSYKHLSIVLFTSGVIAIVLVVIGVILVRVEHVPVSDEHRTLNSLLPGDIRFEPVALLYTGIWLILFTPVIGLLVALVEAVYNHDWRLFFIVVLLLVVLAQGVFTVTVF